MPRFTRLLATVVVAVLLGAACTSDVGSDKGASGEAGSAGGANAVDAELISKAVEATTSASTSRFTYEMTYRGLPQLDGATISGEGAVDTETGAARIVLDLSELFDQIEGSGPPPVGVGGSFESITVGSNIYVNTEMLGDLASAIDAEWIVLGPEETGIDLEALTQGQGIDPEAQLEQLRAMSGIEETGTEDVRGVETTRYAGTIVMSEALETLDEQQQEALAGAYGGDLAAIEDLEVPVVVYLDGDGLLRRMEQTIAFGEIAGSLDGPAGDIDAAELKDAELDIAIEFFDFGADVDIQEPKDAVSFAELFGSSFAGGGFGGETGETDEVSPLIPGD